MYQYNPLLESIVPGLSNKMAQKLQPELYKKAIIKKAALRNKEAAKLFQDKYKSLDKYGNQLKNQLNYGLMDKKAKLATLYKRVNPINHMINRFHF